MAENIPFIHSICYGINDFLQDDPLRNQKLLPTALVAVCISVIINGLLFIILGYFKLGNLLHFFPRYVILGMNAGFGIFLVATAVEISSGHKAQEIMTSTQHLLNADEIMQIMLAVCIEILLRLLSFSGVNDIIISLLMLAIPLGFYVALFITNTSFSVARDHLWLFDEVKSSKWYETWNDFDFGNIDWEALSFQMPTIGLLALFTMTLVPVRIPSLALITNEDVVFDEELIAQGVGNVLSGLLGCPHNYLSYANTIFFYVLQGRGKYSRYALTIITGGFFLMGSEIINYVPRVIASVIMIHLGVDILIGSVIENSRTLTGLEFFCLLLVCITVTLFGFVYGMSVEIVVACMAFVIASSNEENIRAVFTGHEARSDTQWSVKQIQKLWDAIDRKRVEIYVIELQGHLFFGNVQRVIKELQELIDPVFDKIDKRKYPAHRPRGLTRDPLPQCSQASNPEDNAVTKLINVVLDCTFLAGADINAVSGLYKFKQKYESFNRNVSANANLSRNSLNTAPQYQIVFAGLIPSLQAIFEMIELTEKEKTSEPAVSSKESPPLSFSPGSSTAARSFEQQPLLPKAPVPNLNRLSLQTNFHGSSTFQLLLLNLPKSFYPDVNSALHQIEEELLGLLPEAHMFDSPEKLYQQFVREMQGSSFEQTNDDDDQIDPDFSLDSRKPSLSLNTIPPFFHRTQSRSQEELSYSPGKSAPFPSPNIRSIKSLNFRKKKLLESFDQLGANLWEQHDKPLLEELATKLLQFPCQRFKKDEQIWEKDSEASEMGLLIDGRICSLLTDDVQFQVVFPPAIIGLSCIVKEKRRTRTLISNADETKIIFVPMSFLLELEEKNRPVHSVLVTMALRSLYFRQKIEYSLFHAASLSQK